MPVPKRIVQAVETSEFLFKSKAEDVSKLDVNAFEKMLGGIDTFEVKKEDIAGGINMIDFLVEKAPVFPGKGKAREMVTANALSLNKNKTTDVNTVINLSHFTGEKFLLVSKGKKENFLVKVI